MTPPSTPRDGRRRRSAGARRPPSSTIADVAARAGVGVGTVSRVINESGQVSGTTRAKVLAAIDELAYRPHAGARALASGLTATIAMVIPFFTHPSAVERVRGVLDGVSSAGYDLLVCNVASPAQRDEYLGRAAPLDRTDGMLIVSLAPTDAEVDALLAAKVPVMLVDAEHPRLPRLVIDDVAGGVEATKHLTRLGHERVAFVGDTSDPAYGFVASRRRREGYASALRAAGVAPRSEYCREGPHGRESAHRMTDELLALPTPPTAIFAASDLQALGVLEAGRAAGLQIPGDLSVVGFDDLEVSAYVGLTTVRQPLQESGRLGVERLVSGLRGGPFAGEERLPLELVVRTTTAPPRA